MNTSVFIHFSIAFTFKDASHSLHRLKKITSSDKPSNEDLEDFDYGFQKVYPKLLLLFLCADSFQIQWPKSS